MDLVQGWGLGLVQAEVEGEQEVEAAGPAAVATEAQGGLAAAVTAAAGRM